MHHARTVLAILVLGGTGWSQATERISVSIQGDVGGDLPSPLSGFVSADGRYVAFMTPVINTWHVLLRDRMTGTFEILSRDSGGNLGDGTSGLFGIWITPDARFVAFESRADNLVPNDNNWSRDLFVRDRWMDTTERVSVGMRGVEANDESLYPSLSDDGRFVAFTSPASNLVSGDTNGKFDVFVRDRELGTTELVSVAMGGGPGNKDSYVPCISGDGRFVAFESEATDLVPADTNAYKDVFVRDRRDHTTTRVSVATDGTQGNGHSAWPAMSANGQYVVFTSEASNLVVGDTNGTRDVYLHDRRTGMTVRVDVTDGGAQANYGGQSGSISSDGRYVAFFSGSTNLIHGDAHGGDVFVRDLERGTTERVSVTTGGSVTNTGYSDVPSISKDGRYVVFRSSANDLVPGDTNGSTDVFIHDRHASGFTSTCDPGVGVVVDCPCSNPSSEPGRGCDNSSATGGAVLSAGGLAYLSMDDLAFTTSGEGPTATSVLLQGRELIPHGVIYGQGVRCAGGELERLFVKHAVGGGMTAPDFGAGDNSISACSASKGDVIRPGQSRWYVVAYRDPGVLGGCSSGSTFNTTQTGQVTWWP